MRETFYFPSTEPIFERACQLRGFDPKPDDYFYESRQSERMTNTWAGWYNVNTEFSVTSGELELAFAEIMNIAYPARTGFAINGIDSESVIVTDLEENGNCDLNDPEDERMILPVTQFREWLYNLNKNAVERVMGTDEASTLWGLSQQRIKVLCEEGKLESRRIGKHWIINKNQPNPKSKK